MDKVNEAFDYAKENAPFVRERTQANPLYSFSEDLKIRFGLTAWTAERIASIATLKNNGWWYENPSLYDF